MSNAKPRIGVILGSSSDLRLLKKCQETLEAFGEPYEMIIASAHRTPQTVSQWAEGAEGRGLKAIIAAAGAAAALPGVVAAHTALPVVGLPLDTTQLRGMDSLYAIVQMPPGIPVATVGINNAENAALLALAILGAEDAGLRRKLEAYRRGLEEKVQQANERLYAERPNLRPGGAEMGAAAPASPPAASAAAPQEPAEAMAVRKESGAIPRTTSPPSGSRRLRIDPRSPNVEAMERAADVLLDGGVIALPTDTVYGLAADASRPEAVRKLFALKNRPIDKAIPLLIHSRRLLSSIARHTPQEVEALLERYWPGALTVVFKKYAGAFQAASGGETIAVRIPGHGVALGVLAMISRPLAVTSANLAGGEPARHAEAIERQFGGQVDLVLDAGELGAGPVSTVLDVSDRPFRILREGAVGRSDLAGLLGDLLAAE